MSIAVEILCPTCGSELQPVQNFESRTFVHIEDLQYDCTACGYRYSYIDVAISDETTTGEKSPSKPFSCSICNKQFEQSGTMRRHMYVHSSVRPYACNNCDKAFKTKAALKRHNIIHTGECPYECSTCKRKFNQISNLRKHLVIHNNNCPFFCNVCGKGFNQLSNLKKHMVVHKEHTVVSDSSGKPEHSVIPIGMEKNVSRPVVTHLRPADM
ncbi:zinc finger protein 430-like [Uloborus diversus]|uniref:zinc finger protein 430-like n=1 Tax=Uloborus diversus TaxID=327109 RepID=UPI0024092837|nr:zinc finger protein 430-like [Uloborus diversus]